MGKREGVTAVWEEGREDLARYHVTVSARYPCYSERNPNSNQGWEYIDITELSGPRPIIIEVSTVTVIVTLTIGNTGETFKECLF